MTTQATAPSLLCLAPRSKALDRLAECFDVAGDGAAIHVLAQGARANDALRAALGSPRTIKAIALIAPPDVESLDPDIAARLRDIDAPVLVLFGTEDLIAPPDFGHAWRRALKKGFQTFVFGAGPDMANERPEAVATLIGDFLTHGEGFIVKHDDDRLYD